MIDISLYVALNVFALIFAILSMMGNRTLAWGTFAFLGATIASYTALAVGQDGTIGSNGTALVSAGSLLWNAIILTPLFMAGLNSILGLMAFLRQLGVRI